MIFILVAVSLTSSYFCGHLFSCVPIMMAMNPVEQRIILQNERNHIIPSPVMMATLDNCEPRPQQASSYIQ